MKSVLFVATLCLFALPALAQPDTSFQAAFTFNTPSAKTLFESKSLQLFAAYAGAITSQNAAYLGFSSPDTGIVIADDPIPVAVVSLDRIHALHAAAFKNLQKHFTFFKVPLQQSSLIASSIDVSPTANASYKLGYPFLTRSIFGLRDSFVVADQVPKDVFFVVQVPALNLVFLAREKKNGGPMLFHPVFEFPGYGMSRGQPLLLSELWSKIQPNLGNPAQHLAR
jgi:hypothetical protein